MVPYMNSWEVTLTLGKEMSLTRWKDSLHHICGLGFLQWLDLGASHDTPGTARREDETSHLGGRVACDCCVLRSRTPAIISRELSFIFCNAEILTGHLKSHSIIYTWRSYSSSASLPQGATVRKRKSQAWKFPRAPEGLSGTEHAKWTSKRSLLTKAQEQKLLAGLFTLSSLYPAPISTNIMRHQLSPWVLFPSNF